MSCMDFTVSGNVWLDYLPPERIVSMQAAGARCGITWLTMTSAFGLSCMYESMFFGQCFIGVGQEMSEEQHNSSNSKNTSYTYND